MWKGVEGCAALTHWSVNSIWLQSAGPASLSCWNQREKEWEKGENQTSNEEGEGQAI